MGEFENQLRVISFDPDFARHAQELSEQLNAPYQAAYFLDGAKQKTVQHYLSTLIEQGVRLVLVLQHDGLSLRSLAQNSSSGSLVTESIKADFCGPETAYRRKFGGGRRQMLARAVGIKSGVRPQILDLTAGLGRDGFVLASLGCSITWVERSAIAAALLADGLQRARAWAPSHDKELCIILARITLFEADGCDYLRALPSNEYPEVIYLDPMFPARRKRSQVKKRMRIFQQFVGADTDSDQLLQLALTSAKQRVVVKRPRKAPRIEGPSPAFVLEGKSNRYDIYLTNTGAHKPGAAP